jgi:predicted DNA-binding mobile mystery protein A
MWSFMDKLLVLAQLDEQLNQLKKSMPAIPRKGWIRTLRKALGMTIAQLAKRLDVTDSRVVKIETGELEGRVTIRIMHEVAAAMNCQFVYGFIPQTDLTQQVKTRASQLATEQIMRAQHTMTLEDQSVKKESISKHHEKLVNKILSRYWKGLWNS